MHRPVHPIEHHEITANLAIARIAHDVSALVTVTTVDETDHASSVTGTVVEIAEGTVYVREPGVGVWVRPARDIVEITVRHP